MTALVEIFVDGQSMKVPQGISVAAAVLGHEHHNAAFHSNSMDGSPRGPYCLMGVCFECMMEINGQENVQSCLVSVAEGMHVKRQISSESGKDAEGFAFTTQKTFAHSTEHEVTHD